ncbi:MAG: radical SAM protein [Planctomycetes bacterium]|nr:radical SAM protein [Planctomycetota bacterium]
MIYYKTTRDDDPYLPLWERPEWIDPIGHAETNRFPLIVTVEPTNRCQNNCLYCSRQLMERAFGNLDLEIMERIAEECGKHGAAIRHGGFGEPLLHPQIKEIIASSYRHKVLTTIFSNCQLLNEPLVEHFAKHELSEIRFSSSGITPETHNQIRRNSDFNRDFDAKLKMAFDVRERLGAAYPFFTLYTNVIDYKVDEFQKNIDTYVEYYLQWADKIDIDLTMFSRVKDLEHVKDLYQQQTLEEVHKPCVGLFLKVIVHWNGDVFACDKLYNYHEDYYLGTLRDPDFTIEKGYCSDKMKMLRENMTFNMNHDQFEYCKDCYSNTTKWDHLQNKSTEA